MFVREPTTAKGVPTVGHFNRTLAGVLMLRGEEMHKADVAAFCDRRMYARWNTDPLLVASHPRRFRGYDKTAGYIRCGM